MTTFELAPAQETEPGRTTTSDGLGSTVLLDNARWFTNVRWFVVAVFLAIGLAAYVVPDAFILLGFVAPRVWPLAFCGIILAGNILLLVLLPRSEGDGPLPVEAHLWLQITFDLLLVTALTHFVGSVETFVSFTYLFHITLACIFLPRMKSLRVVVMAALLYLGLVWLEIRGILTPRSLIPNHQLLVADNAVLPPVFALSGVLVWVVVWHLVSRLSASVRERDHKLNVANEQLREADIEKNRQMLRTAHDLKAPFSGIESNIQILKLQHWDETPQPVRELIDRIQLRAQTLSERIRDILILGDLHSAESDQDPAPAARLTEVFDSVVEDLKEKAKDRSITLDINVMPLTVRADKKQLCIMFSNLVANGISYSREGGTVKVSAVRAGSTAVISVGDDGIGIKAEALPHIFDEYYRSKEAARFNRLSTGLGLAIVKRIAVKLGLQIKVTSEVDKGTMFEVVVPLGAEPIHNS